MWPFSLLDYEHGIDLVQQIPSCVVQVTRSNAIIAEFEKERLRFVHPELQTIGPSSYELGRLRFFHLEFGHGTGYSDLNEIHDAGLFERCFRLADLEAILALPNVEEVFDRYFGKDAFVPAFASMYYNPNDGPECSYAPTLEYRGWGKLRIGYSKMWHYFHWGPKPYPRYPILPV